MKKLLRLTVLLTLAIGLVSCQKSLQDQLVGTYQFKMSGSFDCQIFSKESTDTAKCIASALSGEMRIIKLDEENLAVNMSVLFGGELLSFQAKLQNDTIVLKDHAVNMKVAPEGSQTTTSFLSTGKVVSLIMNGRGKLFSDTILFTMHASGQFDYTDSDGDNYICVVIPQTTDIVCQAYRKK